MLEEWSDKYCIGIGEIDEQHKTFFDATHRLREEILNGTGENAVEGALNFLRNYSAEHFRLEEAFMRKHDYGKLDEHRALHVDFLEMLDGLTDNYDIYRAPTQAMADEILALTQDWLLDHIIDEDTLYARHVKAQG